MEIHAPSGPTQSFKDFAIHILIVTIGILIAFGLEGVRESWRESKAVAEARLSLQEQLRFNQQQLVQELVMVKKANSDLDRVLAHLSELAKTPAVLRTQVMNISLGFHFFMTTAWDSALASGVLAHMDRAELLRFDDPYTSIKNYQDAEKLTLPDSISVNAYFGSRRSFSPGELTTAEEKLRSLRIKTEALEHVGAELTAGLKTAIGEDERSH
jgi:hypothetical protein